MKREKGDRMRKLLYIFLMCSSVLCAERMEDHVGLHRYTDTGTSMRQQRRHARMRSRVHKPSCGNPLCEAKYDSAISEFMRLLCEYNIIQKLSVPVTIFAPKNGALAMKTLRHMSSSQVRTFLQRHIVVGYILPRTIVEEADVRNLNGEELTFTRDDDELEIADVRIERHRETPHAVLYHISQAIDD